MIERQSDTTLSIFMSVLVAYAGYIVAEELGVSGVLGAVVSGIYGGWNSYRLIDAGTRLSAQAFWRVMTFGLEALLFVLLGLQAPQLAEEIDIGSLAGQARRRRAVRRRRADGLRDAARRASATTLRERIVVGWAGHARGDLARRGAGRQHERAGAVADPPDHLRCDLRHARRAGPDAARRCCGR